MKIEKGYKAYNGHVFSADEARRYNQVTEEIERSRYVPTQEILKDQRHKMFCSIIGVQGV